MSLATDVAPKAISGSPTVGLGWVGLGLEISGEGYAKSTFGVDNP